MAAHHQLVRPPPLRFLERVAEQGCKRRVDIDDFHFVIGDDHRAVGPVGDSMEQRRRLPSFDLRGDVPDECDGALLTTDLDARQRQRGTKPAAVLARDPDLGARCREGGVAVHLNWGRRRNVMQLLEPQTAHMATEHFGAIQPPDPFGRRVEITHLKIAIDDDNGIVGALERGQQQIRSFSQGVLACAHHPTLMPSRNPSRPSARWRGAILSKSVGSLRC